MKHFRLLLPLLILALVLSGCGSTAREPYDYAYNGKTLKIYPESGTIMDGLDVYRYTEQATGRETYYEIIYPNGGRYYWTATKSGGLGGWSDGYNDKLYLSGDLLINALEAAQPRQRTGNPAVGLLLAVLGLWQFLSPETVFYLKKGWMFKNAEPSESYLFLCKLGGVLILAIGLVWCFI